MIDRDDPLPVTHQCDLLEVARSTVYYQPRPTPQDDIDVMGRIDQIHLDSPFLGSRRIVDALAEAGIVVNRKKVQRLMRLMGLAALYPKPRTTIPAVGHRIYPYLLRGLKSETADHDPGGRAPDLPLRPPKRGQIKPPYRGQSDCHGPLPEPARQRRLLIGPSDIQIILGEGAPTFTPPAEAHPQVLIIARRLAWSRRGVADSAAEIRRYERRSWANSPVALRSWCRLAKVPAQGGRS